MGKGSKKNTRKRGKAATAAGETWGGPTWDEWQQSRHILRVPRIRETIFDRMDRRLARIDQRLAEIATAPAPLPSPSAAPVRKLSGKEWIPIAFKRRRDELLALSITEAGKVLAEESKTAPDCRKPLSAGYCTNELRKLNGWAPKPRSPK